MTRELHPAFADEQPIEAAEALSEPFLRPSDFTALMPNVVAIELEPVAAGVSYIAEDDSVQYSFSLVPDAEYPLSYSQAFIEGYEQVVGHFHAHRRLQERSMPESVAIGHKYHMDLALEKTKAAGLRTVAGFIVFTSLKDNPYAKSFVTARKPAEEIPLEGRDYAIKHRDNPATGQFAAIQSIMERATGERPETIPQGILTNDSINQRFGMFVGALHMPDGSEAREKISLDPRVGDYFSLPRKERRKLLRQERKQA